MSETYGRTPGELLGREGIEGYLLTTAIFLYVAGEKARDRAHDLEQEARKPKS